jgi:MFS family permease
MDHRNLHLRCSRPVSLDQRCAGHSASANQPSCPSDRGSTACQLHGRGLGVSLVHRDVDLQSHRAGPDSTGYGIELPVLLAGFVMLPLSVGSFSANRLVRRLSRRVSLTTLLPMGAGLVGASGMLLWFAHTELWEILLAMLIFGLGMGTSYAAMPALIARSVANEELGSSVSFNQVLRTVGSSFGTAISGAVLAGNMGDDLHPTGVGITTTLALGALLCAAVFVALLIHTLVAYYRRAIDGRRGALVN